MALVSQLGCWWALLDIEFWLCRSDCSLSPIGAGTAPIGGTRFLLGSWDGAVVAKHFRTVLAVAATGAVATGVILVADGGSTTTASKPSSSGSSLSVVVKTGPDGVPNFGETITFSVVSPVYKKWVDLYCFQNGAAVYAQTDGFFPEYPWGQDYPLASSYWTSGAANCTATLFTVNSKGRRSNLATLSFGVGA